MGALPTGRPGKLLALTVTLIVAAALWIGAIAPLLGWYGERAELLAQQRLLARRMTAMVETLPALRRQSSQAAAGPAADALLQGGSDAVAGAALQQMVQDMAGGFGLTFTSVETLPPQQEGRYRRIRLRVAVSAPWPVLVHLLASIEQARPQMLIDNLELEAAPILVHPGGLPLNAGFTILGFREGTAPPAGQ